MAITAMEVLREHEQTWDMPSLTDNREILDYLIARWDVQFDIVGHVVVMDKRSRQVRRYQTFDVREALRDLLIDESGQEPCVDCGQVTDCHVDCQMNWV